MYSDPVAFVVAVLLVGLPCLIILLIVLHIDLRRRHRRAKVMLRRMVEERDDARRELARRG